MKNLKEPVIWKWYWTASFPKKKCFPAIDILKSGTRREDLLLSKEEQEAVESMRKGLNGLRPEEAVDNILNMFSRTKNNEELIQMVKKRQNLSRQNLILVLQ